MAPRLIPLLLLCATAPGQQGSTNEPVFRKECGSCHSVSLIDDLKSVPEWEETVDEMIDRGAKASPAERAAILRYLIRNYTRFNINTASAEEISAVLDMVVSQIAPPRHSQRNLFQSKHLYTVPRDYPMS